jgi:hypothetical protein
MRYRTSPAQRDLICQFLRKLELYTKSICLLHRPIFEAAGIWSPVDLDRPLDAFIADLTNGQASNLIKALQERLQEGKK